MPKQVKSVPFFLPTQAVYDTLVAAVPNKINPKFAVYMTAVLEYMTAEIIEAAVKKAKDRKSRNVTSEDITSAMHNDPELKKAFPVTDGDGNSK